MPHLPAMINLTGKRCVIIGGGKVATRRARALLDARADVFVVAPVFTPELVDMSVTRRQRAYQPGDLEGAVLVVIATDDPAVNDQIMHDARNAGAMINRTDAPDLGDLTIPAHAQLGPITLAVSAGGASSSAAVTLRDELISRLDPDWARLLACAAEYRPELKARHADPARRRRALAGLADAEAMAILKAQGEAGLVRYYASL